MNLTASREYSIIITDTSCFITLEKIGALEILRQTFKNVVTTPEILGEFGAGLPKWIEIKPVQDKVVQSVFKETVDDGEASAIALAMETANPILIIDDLKGRKLASKMAITFMGTLGLLVKAKEFGVISNVKPYLEKIQATDFRVSKNLVDIVLQNTGEK
jgi:predicted nucleic acid-binding protein